MNKWAVVEKNNYQAVHVYTWSRQRAEEWIEEYGDSGIFTDKTLNKDSFTIVQVGHGGSDE